MTKIGLFLRRFLIVKFSAVDRTQHQKLLFLYTYRKIPKISPSMYKPPKIVTQKTLREIAPPNISPPRGACTWNLPSNTK